MNEWLEKYRRNMDGRYPTYKIAFDLLYQMPNHSIVETGCIRLKDDWGAGYSTMLFGEFCDLYGGKIISVDLFPRHIEIAKNITNTYNNFIDYVESDSVEFLKNYNEPIDLLYLDSLDVPIGTGEDRTLCQEHNLKEFISSEPNLHRYSIVLVDDYFGGNGKGRLTEKYMLEKGWRLIVSNQQQLFIR